jgi:hypothetical protein
MSQPGISIFSPGTSRHQDLGASSDPESDTSESSGPESARDSEDSSSSESSDVESSSGSDRNGAPSDDASDSDGFMDVDEDNDSMDEREMLKRSDPKASAWLRQTAEERAICDAMDRDEDTNLTQHIMNAHGFYARGSTLSDEHSRRRRKGWISGWRPPKSWTAWPLAPVDVPRRPYRVWDTSIMMNEQWVPSRGLESEVFAYMLKRSRLRWKRRAGETSVKKTELESRNSEMYPSERSLIRDEKPAKFDETSQLRSTDIDEVVISADDEKSWALARPVVRSILTDFDSVLSALRLSAIHATRGSCEI